MTNSINTKIYYGIYDIDFDQFYVRNDWKYKVHDQFKEFIQRFAETRWRWKYQSRKFPFILFTIGVDGDIQALAIVHEKEQHNNYTKGKEIVEGRLNRQLGLLNRVTYDNIPAKDEDGTIMEDEKGFIIYKEVPPYIITGD